MHYARWRKTGTTELRPKPSTSDRFWAKVNKSGATASADLGECWEWTAGTSLGYGHFFVDSRTRKAHEWAWEKVHGKKPNDLVLDHLCRNRACVRLSHLELVPQEINQWRGLAGSMRTHCPKGHPYDETNTRWVKGHKRKRSCRACNRERNSTPERRAYIAEFKRRRRLRK